MVQLNFTFIFYILQNELVQPIITPRFALSCDMKLMMLLGDLAAKYNAHIQVKFYCDMHCKSARKASTLQIQVQILCKTCIECYTLSIELYVWWIISGKYSLSLLRQVLRILWWRSWKLQGLCHHSTRQVTTWRCRLTSFLWSVICTCNTSVWAAKTVLWVRLMWS